MSYDRSKKQKKLHNDEKAIDKQIAILKSCGSGNKKLMNEPNRMKKQHAMDCGTPNCPICGNPRKIYNQLPISEKRFAQNNKDEH